MPDQPIAFSMLPILLFIELITIWFITRRAIKQRRAEKSNAVLRLIERSITGDKVIAGTAGW